MHEAEASSSHPIDLASRALAVRSLHELVNRPDRIGALNVGCSSGFLIQNLLTRLPTLSIFGADYLMGVVVKAARRNPGIPFRSIRSSKVPSARQMRGRRHRT